ncbi:MAG: DNA polymerase domain-containing protein [Candidatus Thermoplasmatota archaeon]|nr:DNA polymerase domain-containing protein [Candidatus Thermoplasmatota archaeon]
MKVRIMVISGHYRRCDDGVVIELFGRSEDGRSLTCLYEDFSPYFYIVAPDQRVFEELGNDPLVIDTEKRDLMVDGRMNECLKVVVKYPYDVPSYRKRWSEEGFRILAADIPFVNRFYYDLDLGSYVEVEGEMISDGRYHTDAVMMIKGIDTVVPFPIKLKVLSFDIENSIRTGELYMVGYSVGWLPDMEEGPISNSIVASSQDVPDLAERELGLIDDLSKIVLEQDPDIITGYNIDGYDIPHIKKRAKTNGPGTMIMGRDGSDIEKVGYRTWKIKGRIVVDAWREAKKAFRPKKETLEAVSQLVLGEGKDEIDTQRIEEEWQDRKDEVIAYCKKDAELALRILDRTQSVKRAMALSYVSMLPLLEIMTGTTSVLIDSILIRKADREDIGIPLTRKEAKTDKIEGAYVHSMEPGLYKWVIVLDFRSMYPSLMIEHNICFTTLTDSASDGSSPIIEGVHFLSSKKYRGLIPRILQGLMNDRQDAKTRMSGSLSSFERDYYNGLQEALKVLMNSFYGVFASYFYRFTNRAIGASITAYARDSILKLISSLSDEGLDVIYSDTDSVFIKSPYEDIDGAVSFGKDLSSKHSREYSMLEFEKVFSSFFTHGKKKRYVGKTVYPSEDMIVRGYEMRRTDAFDLQSTSLSDLFKMILDGNIKEGLSYAREVIRRCRSGDVETSSLVISRSVQEVEEDRIEEAYKNPDSMSNVQALRKARDLGIEIVPGMKVSWVVVDGRASPQIVEPYIDGREFVDIPDYLYYSERLASTLARVTEVFGVDQRGLITGSSQSSLFDGYDTADTSSKDQVTKNKMEKDERTSGEMTATLDRWM